MNRQGIVDKRTMAKDMNAYVNVNAVTSSIHQTTAFSPFYLSADFLDYERLFLENKVDPRRFGSSNVKSFDGKDYLFVNKND